MESQHSGQARPERPLRRIEVEALPLPGRAGDGSGPFGATPLRIRLSVRAESARRRLAALIEQERERRTGFNLLPVAFAAGILAYFAADRAPLWWGPPLALALLVPLIHLCASREGVRSGLVVLAVAVAGLWAAALRTSAVEAPRLERPRIGLLAGFVETVEPHGSGKRLVVHVTAFANMAPREHPKRVRITATTGDVRPGDHIRVMARLTPLPEPARPGGYDFARDAFFRGFGAVGTALGVPASTPAPDVAPWPVRANALIDDARNAMTQRIAAVIGGQAGALAAALVTGKRGLISEETNEALRAAGLYHIVSISGLHMALAAGAIFWLVRAGLALSATAAHRLPLKKIAAGAAMVGAVAYTIFSGAEVATVRSCIMSLIMLGAILFDRPALSLRNLALAALVVLAREPEALLGPSFQMSFGAVAALVAFAEWSRQRPRQDRPAPGPAGQVARMVAAATGGLLATSLLASLATGPFAAYHFQTFNPYGLIGNMLALPFVSLVVMPAAVVGAVLYPLGLDAAAWWVMGLATEPVLMVSRQVASFGGAVTVLPAFGPGALILLAMALIIATMLTTQLRMLATVPLVAALALATRPDRPDIFIDRDGTGAAVRAADGSLAVLGRPGAFVLQQWLRADGDSRRTDDAGLRLGASCDRRGCVIALASGRTVSFSRDPVAIAEDCDRATLVITPLTWRGACQALMVDRTTLDRFGAIAIHDRIEGFTAIVSRDSERPRPWQPRAQPSPTPMAGPAPAAAEAAPAVPSPSELDQPHELPLQ